MEEKNVGIYANCQGTIGLHFYLKKLFPQWNFYIMINYGYIKNMLKFNYSIINKLDIFIYQPLDIKHGVYSTSIDNKESVINFLNDNCIKISFPYIYNDAFWCLVPKEWDSYAIPTDKEIHGININGCHNSEIILNLKNNQNKTLKEILILFINNLIDFKFEERFNNTIDIFKKKETLCNIKVVDFIINNYRKKNLFLTKNHPTSYIFEHMLKQILNILNIQKSLDLFDFNNDNLCNLPGRQPYSGHEISFFKYEFNVISNNNYYINLINNIYINN